MAASISTNAKPAPNQDHRHQQCGGFGVGQPGEGKQVKTWRATGNGLEGAAAMANDNLLVLDEIGELSDPKELGNVIYFLGNGGETGPVPPELAA